MFDLVPGIYAYFVFVSLSLSCYAIQSGISSFANILLRKRETVGLVHCLVMQYVLSFLALQTSH